KDFSSGAPGNGEFSLDGGGGNPNFSQTAFNGGSTVSFFQFLMSLSGGACTVYIVQANDATKYIALVINAITDSTTFFSFFHSTSVLGSTLDVGQVCNVTFQLPGATGGSGSQGEQGVQGEPGPNLINEST